MNHEAIYALYPEVVRIDDTEGAFDINGNKIIIDELLVSSWINPLLYKKLREKEYPSIEEQLDIQYWDKVNGTTVWIDTINSIKLKYPKG
jgi:hypothetical protein